MSNRTGPRRRTVSVLIALLAGGALALTACASDTQPGSDAAGAQSPSESPTQVSSAPSTQQSSAPASSTQDSTAGTAPDGLAGYLFTSTSATGRTLVKDKPLTISFGDRGEVGLHAGCNGMGGTPVFTAAELKVDQIVSTMMACVDPAGGNSVMDQENWYGKWLTAGVSWKLDGTDLVLSGDGVSVTFERTGKADEKPTAGSGEDGSAAATSSTASQPSVPAEHTAITAPLVEPATPVQSTTPPGKTRDGGVSVDPPPTSTN